MSMMCRSPWPRGLVVVVMLIASVPSWAQLDDGDVGTQLCREAQIAAQNGVAESPDATPAFQGVFRWLGAVTASGKITGRCKSCITNQIARDVPAEEQEPCGPDVQPTSFQDDVDTQKRINRYFHETVVPRLITCWDQVEGVGKIEFEYTYEENFDGGWEFEELGITESTLPAGQDPFALTCMRDSVAGTSFPTEETDDATVYTLFWTWPVPFPPNYQEQVQNMFLDNGGATSGCDGNGAPANCKTCGKGSTCLATCDGFSECPRWMPCEEQPINCQVCGEKGGNTCTSGGLFGVKGWNVIFAIQQPPGNLNPNPGSIGP